MKMRMKITMQTDNHDGGNGDDDIDDNNGSD